MLKILFYLPLALFGLVSYSQLECPTLVSPPNGSVNIPSSTNISWAESPGASGYLLTLGTSPTSDNILSKTIYMVNYTEEIDFPANSTIYVTITPFNDMEIASGCPKYSFNTKEKCWLYLSPQRDIVVCENYQLPDLPSANQYNTETNGTGNILQAGDIITKDQIIYIMTDTGSCWEQSSFSVIIDPTICIDPAKIMVYPKFFTPNGDGINDLWHPNWADLNPTLRSAVFIYDRYGKLVRQLDFDSPGWDGSSHGTPLPASDYWFTMELGDNNFLSGHFALKR
ncbi:hypothetical protein DHD05_13765 [Arenibacter sp. N53]|uniref:T9SS type B sorting domain-containing protein n=1 Tax=Arenibacter TaxID=178469 RepID=UPI000CD3D015|nr:MULTISPECIES: T9SS type B sorting domain-containing protein [Arenibacter]MCM4152660.1 hypothetical protein [Arenibacter sp. N53]